MGIISIEIGKFEMMVVYNYGHVIQIDGCIHVTVDGRTISYIILGCFVAIIGFNFCGYSTITFGRIRLGIGHWVLIW